MHQDLVRGLVKVTDSGGRRTQSVVVSIKTRRLCLSMHIDLLLANVTDSGGRRTQGVVVGTPRGLKLAD